MDVVIVHIFMLWSLIFWLQTLRLMEVNMELGEAMVDVLVEDDTSWDGIL